VDFPVVYPEQFDPRTVRELFGPQNQHPNCSRTVRPDHRTVRELFDPTSELFANCSTHSPNNSRTVRPSSRPVGSLIGSVCEHLAHLSGFRHRNSKENERRSDCCVLHCYRTMYIFLCACNVLVKSEYRGGGRVKKSYRKSKTASGLQY
jgi:hypothetical protein